MNYVSWFKLILFEHSYVCIFVLKAFREGFGHNTKITKCKRFASQCFPKLIASARAQLPPTHSRQFV